MTFLFEDTFSGEFRYVNAPDLLEAIEIFNSYDSSDSSDFEQLHVYVRLI